MTNNRKEDLTTPILTFLPAIYTFYENDFILKFKTFVCKPT